MNKREPVNDGWFDLLVIVVVNKVNLQTATNFNVVGFYYLIVSFLIFYNSNNNRKTVTIEWGFPFLSNLCETIDIYIFLLSRYFQYVFSLQ